VSRGPLVVRWGDWTLPELQAGVETRARVEIENAGSIAWRNGIFLAYHWLDDRGNPIVWDGIRTTLPVLEPGARATIEPRIRGPIPPGRYRLALDVVAEHRAWFSELGSETATRDVQVGPRRAETSAQLPVWVEPGPEWNARVGAAHAEGYAVVAGAVDWPTSLWRRRPRALEPYRPGVGRVPGFAHPLLCPSVAADTQLERLPDLEGLPAFAAPRDEPWLYDGRIVLRARPDRR
jgi:hypothetical protein